MHSSHESCSAALCPAPVDIDNGVMTFTGDSVGDTATYTCDSGFELIGAETTTCILSPVDENSAAFQPAPPSCRCEYTGYKLPALEWLYTDMSFSIACVDHSSTYIEEPLIYL